jgi:hypothetical protein
MKRHVFVRAIAAALIAGGCGGSSEGVGPTGVPSAAMSFFVTSAKSTTGNLGGLRGADNLCRTLAIAAGSGSRRVWQAYLSVERDSDNNGGPTHARSRIGDGPWVNANGTIVSVNLTELHARRGDATVFVDERGQPIPGQWPGSPRPVEHDILTGSTSEGMLLAGRTCHDWTSSATTVAAQVGHSDGLGPGGSTSGALTSWNSSHASGSCANTAPGGGAGRIYCFATN